MATTLNPFFKNLAYSQEQRLIESLAIESIKIYGVNCYYMPRTHVNIDGLFLQDTLSQFNNAILMEMYIKNFEGWTGEGDLMSKFGISMADQITFSVARRRFAESLADLPTYIRPLEGDLIYFPIPNAIFEVKFVEHESIFYQTGSLQFYDIKCERFNYNSEVFNTGIPEIDAIALAYTNTTQNYRLMDTVNNFITTTDGNRIVLAEYSTTSADATNENEYFETTSDEFIDFNLRNVFGD